MAKQPRINTVPKLFITMLHVTKYYSKTHKRKIYGHAVVVELLHNLVNELIKISFWNIKDGIYVRTSHRFEQFQPCLRSSMLPRI